MVGRVPNPPRVLRTRQSGIAVSGIYSHFGNSFRHSLWQLFASRHLIDSFSQNSFIRRGLAIGTRPPVALGEVSFRCEYGEVLAYSEVHFRLGIVEVVV